MLMQIVINNLKVSVEVVMATFILECRVLGQLFYIVFARPQITQRDIKENDKQNGAGAAGGESFACESKFR